MADHQPTIERITLPTPYLVGPVHVYLIRSKEFEILIDTGPPTDAAWTALHTAIDPSRLDALLLTHCHPDHYGLAARLANDYAIPVYLSRRDAAFFGRENEYLDGMLAQAALLGVPSDEQGRVRDALGSARRGIAPPLNFCFLEEAGDELGRYGISALHCPGHSQGDHVFLVGNQAIDGDVLIAGALPVPLLDVRAEDFGRRFENYPAWCKALARLGQLGEVTLLPAHGDAISAIAAEIGVLVTRLLDRAASLAPMLKGQDDLYALGCALYAQRFEQPFMQYLKLSELVFMRDLLIAPTLLLDALDSARLASPFRQRFVSLPQL
ncbi:MAG: MBL fold metallo-hydrolase [Desulfuromonadales bacterium]|nr:MBL fold metallo-hydrolase [Desulfuromonadales bacterium]